MYDGPSINSYSTMDEVIKNWFPIKMCQKYMTNQAIISWGNHFPFKSKTSAVDSGLDLDLSALFSFLFGQVKSSMDPPSCYSMSLDNSSLVSPAINLPCLCSHLTRSTSKAASATHTTPLLQHTLLLFANEFTLNCSNGHTLFWIAPRSSVVCT
jgi:hypothetical protein